MNKQFFAAWGQRGGKARAHRLSPSKRSAIAAQAANARWRGRPSLSRLTPSVRLDQPRFEDPLYLEEILEEGSLDDWKEIYRRIADYPFGPTAEALERVLSSSATYGVTPLWKGILRTVQGTFYCDRCRAIMGRPIP